MTDGQAKVFEALSRGRLIFPFKEERSELRARAAAGPLIDDEAVRLADLDSAFEDIKAKDQWFHSAMQSGDIEAAGKVAAEALDVLQELA